MYPAAAINGNPGPGVSSGQAIDKMEAVAKFVQELKGVPTWAVGIACERIRMGVAPGISHVFEPTTIQLRVLAVEIAQPCKQEAIAIGNIVAAERYQEPVSAEQRARVGELLAGLSRELRERIESVQDDAIERDRPRAQALTQSYIEQEYRSRGEEPVMTNKGMLISRSLAQQLGKMQPK